MTSGCACPLLTGALVTVAMNSIGGYRNHVSVALTGLDVEAKAAAVEAALWRACPFQPSDYAHLTTRLIRSDHPDPTTNETATAELRITVKDPDERKVGRAFTNAMVETVLCNIPGMYALSGAPGDGAGVVDGHEAVAGAVHEQRGGAHAAQVLLEARPAEQQLQDRARGAEEGHVGPRELAAVAVHRAVGVEDGPGEGLRVEPAQVEAVTQALLSHVGAAMTVETLDTLRVEEGLPWHGIDVTEENLLHETGQLSVYHSASKGCYLGQEVVARLEGRGGNVNKKFLGLRCSAAVAAGAEVVAEDKVIGRVTSAGMSPKFGAIAMGYLHRSHAEPGTTVNVDAVICTVSNLPFEP